MKSIKLLITIIALAGLASCATAKKDDCCSQDKGKAGSCCDDKGADAKKHH